MSAICVWNFIVIITWALLIYLGQNYVKLARKNFEISAEFAKKTSEMFERAMQIAEREKLRCQHKEPKAE